MTNDRSAHRSPHAAQVTSPGREAGATVWARPSFEVIALDCEITAYAPDGDSPLY